MTENIKVIRESANTTDLVLGLSSTMKEDWNINKIIDDLKECDLSDKSAEDIARGVEETVISIGKDVSIELIREIIDIELYRRGWTNKLRKHKSLNLPVKYFEQISFDKTTDNANFQNNNPELVSHTINEILGKQYALNYVFDKEASNAHMNGEIYIHDMGQPNRYYCWAASLAYILKNGLKLDSVTSRSLPANSASVLTGHLQTYLASMQAYFAGAIGITYTNIVYAPLLRGLTNKQIKQVCQEIVFSISQTAFARGGQSLHPSETVIIKRDDKIQIVRIGELVDEQVRKFGGPTDKGIERTGYNLEQIKVLSFNSEKKCDFLPITDFIRTKHNKKNMVKLITSKGICNITDYHSVFADVGGVVKPIKASELNMGDSIVVANKISTENECLEGVDGFETNENFGRMLAHVLFGLSLTNVAKQEIKIVNDPDVVEDFRKMYDGFFNDKLSLDNIYRLEI